MRKICHNRLLILKCYLFNQVEISDGLVLSYVFIIKVMQRTVVANTALK